MQQANPSNLWYLFMTGLSCMSCTNGQRWSDLERLRQEHMHIISKGLELHIFASWDKKRKKSTSGYYLKLEAEDILHFHHTVTQSYSFHMWSSLESVNWGRNKLCMHLGFPSLAGAVGKWKYNKTVPYKFWSGWNQEKFKSLGEKEKLAGRFLGHDIIICSAWRLFEAYPIRTFWGLPIIKRWLLLTTVRLCRLAQKNASATGLCTVCTI